MLIVISPAKTLDFETPAKTKVFTTPDHLKHSQQLVDRLRTFSALDIADLMKVSMNIAELNQDRFATWKTPFTQKNAKQAILAFRGDVYNGIQADTFTSKDFKFAQAHLRVLSGLYGLLRPLDLMQPYRLEMGTRLENTRGKNLYAFWDMEITNSLNQQLKKIKSKHLINLASNEYFKSVKHKSLDGEIITPMFKDYNNGAYKMIGVYAKKARGMLSKYIIQNQLIDPEDLKSFSEAGYCFNKKLSEGNNWVFTRRI